MVGVSPKANDPNALMRRFARALLPAEYSTLLYSHLRLRVGARDSNKGKEAV